MTMADAEPGAAELALEHIPTRRAVTSQNTSTPIIVMPGLDPGILRKLA